METNSVLLRPENEIELDDMFLRETDAGILSAAQRYIELQAKSADLLGRAEDRHLSGTPGTIYLKRLGHRPLSTADFENMVIALGSAEDKQALIDFSQAKQDLVDRLKTTKIIGVILEQAGLTNNLFYYRVKYPEKWKPEEIVKIMNVLDRLQV